MIKKLFSLEMERLDWFENWPNWLRWILCLPVSIGVFIVFRLLVSFANQWHISEDTFLGYCFIYVVGPIVILYVFYDIIPKHKMIFTTIMSIGYFLFNGIIVISSILVLVIGENLNLKDIIIMKLVPSILVIFFLSILMGIFKRDSKKHKLV